MEFTYDSNFSNSFGADSPNPEASARDSLGRTITLDPLAFGALGIGEYDAYGRGVLAGDPLGGADPLEFAAPNPWWTPRYDAHGRLDPTVDVCAAITNTIYDCTPRVDGAADGGKPVSDVPDGAQPEAEADESIIILFPGPQSHPTP